MPLDLGERASGVLLHPTSLPGPHGVGDLGPQAHAWVEWLRGADQGWWQMLPVGPLGYGNSPYSAQSAFAGNKLLISLDFMAQDGLLPRAALSQPPPFPRARADYAGACRWREKNLRLAFAAFQKRQSDRAQFESFCADNAQWLDDYALYAAIKRSRGDVSWTEWPAELRARDDAALDRARSALREEIEQRRFEQFVFDRQWRALRAACKAQGIGLIGDLPIFVAHDSADVWANRELFFLDAQGQPTVVAGVPPDYFSKTGQRWGNPLYRWDVLERSGFRWWLQRFARVFSLFDAVRLDHFIGFTRYWEIPAAEPTAQNGRWMPAPGAKLFEKLGPAQLIAEDLGEVTPEVTALRDRFGFPGMKLLQFAFGTDPQAATFLPYSYPRCSVAYTGTHDNDTTRGWFEEIPEEERRNALAYLGTSSGEIAWDMLREVWKSVANLAVAPVQDLLGLGSDRRMNRPSTIEGNWEFRLEALPGDGVQKRLQDMTRIYGRSAR